MSVWWLVFGVFGLGTFDGGRRESLFMVLFGATLLMLESTYCTHGDISNDKEKVPSKTIER